MKRNMKHMLYHLEDIEKIRDYEQQAQNLGIKVFDISHWDSGNNYKKLLLSTIHIDNSFQPCDYIYSYVLDEITHLNVQKHLIGTCENSCSIFFANSTISIVNICNYLQKNNLRKICLIQPSYFTVVPCMNAFGLKVDELSLSYSDGKYIIPLEQILCKGCDAVWITSPVFCTSTYFCQQEINKIQFLLDQGIYVIFDESLSLKELSVRRELTNTDKLFSIFSPHKVISTNAFKFSCVICHVRNEKFFDQWVDIFSGGLMNSSKLAITHFLSVNYSKCVDVYKNYTSDMKETIVNFLSTSMGSDIEISHEIGQYMTLYLRNVPYRETIESHFIKKMILSTGVSLLPGYLEGFFEELGFCFRINLTLDKTMLLTSLNRVIKYLKEIYS